MTFKEEFSHSDRINKMLKPIVPFMCLGVGLGSLSCLDMIKCYPYEIVVQEQEVVANRFAMENTIDISAMANDFITEKKNCADVGAIVSPTLPTQEYLRSSHTMVDFSFFNNVHDVSLPKVSLCLRNDANNAIADVEKEEAVCEEVDTENHIDVVEGTDVVDDSQQSEEVDCAVQEYETFFEYGTTFTATNDIVCTHGIINIRYGPGNQWRVMMQLPKGTVVRRIGKGQYGWDKIDYNGTIAYAWSKFLHDMP